jgi:hypothetical protein
MDNPKPHKQAPEFTRDEVARMLVVTLDQVLEALHVQQIVAGIAVLPAGEGVYLVDIVMRDQTTKSTWGLSVIIPPSQEETHERG